MSLTRSLSILRSLSPNLRRYSGFYCYERLFLSSGGADDPRPGDWMVLLSEEKLKRIFDDFPCEFKELKDRINSIQTTQPITPDWEFEKQSEKFLSDYKQIKDESLQNSGMQPIVLISDVDEPPPPPEDLARKKFEKQLGCSRIWPKKFSVRTDKILSICPTIMGKFWLLTKGYSSSIDNRNTFVMKLVKDEMNVLKNFYRKLGKTIRKHPHKYYRFHHEWHFTTQMVISVLAFDHWIETGSLLLHGTVEEKLGFEPPEFDLDLEDYLLGLCIMSEDLTTYANGVYLSGNLSGNYDCLRNIAVSMINMEETVGVLFLSNDELHEIFEGFKHNVKRVQDMMSAADWLLKE